MCGGQTEFLVAWWLVHASHFQTLSSVPATCKRTQLLRKASETIIMLANYNTMDKISILVSHCCRTLFVMETFFFPPRCVSITKNPSLNAMSVWSKHAQFKSSPCPPLSATGTPQPHPNTAGLACNGCWTISTQGLIIFVWQNALSYLQDQFAISVLTTT